MADVTGAQGGNLSVLETKKVLVTEKLQRREDERLAFVQKRKEEKEDAAAISENVDLFNEKFNETKRDIENSLARSESLDKSALASHFESLSISVQRLNKFLTDSTLFLPSYDLKRNQEVISKLQNSIQEKKDQLLPKKKFAFRGKAKKTVDDKPEADKKSEVKVDTGSVKPVKIDVTDGTLSDVSGGDLLKHEDDVNDKDLALSRLTDCTVKLCGSPGAVHINKLKNCRVFTGPVSGSVFIDNCTNCTFVMPCQQMRIHSTTDTNFYIHVTSRAIIEDCSGLGFAPYTWSYANLAEHYHRSGLDQSRNTWNDVDDFNWLASDKASPNWCVLPEDKRIDWTDF